MTQAWVSGVRLTADGILQVVGTSGDDHVTINQQGNGILKVHADFLQSGNFEKFDLADVDKIIAYLCEGDDHFTIAGNVDIPAIVHGDGGDDHLNGGGGPTVLLGDDGDDMLVGGSGRDILIGGLGADRLVGGKSDDVLIGGTTNADDDDDALMAVLAAWTSNDSYDDRVQAIGALLTVVDDEEEDKLTGSSGLDLFYAGLGDILTDLKNAETVL
jgi:Ca2+-binding RTX toxin-like protein